MNEIDELEDILDTLLNAVQEVLRSGEVLPEELQNQIAQEITLLNSEIDQLYEAHKQQEAQEELQEAEQEQAEVAKEVSPPTPEIPTSTETIPPLESAPHESSNINAFRYDPNSGKLYVKFQDKYPGTNGPVYSYEGVPPYIFDLFRRGAVGPKTSGSNGWHTWKKNVSPSHGAAMYALIKQGGYKYAKLS